MKTIKQQVREADTMLELIFWVLCGLLVLCLGALAPSLVRVWNRRKRTDDQLYDEFYWQLRG